MVGILLPRRVSQEYVTCIDDALQRFLEDRPWIGFAKALWCVSIQEFLGVVVNYYGLRQTVSKISSLGALPLTVCGDSQDLPRHERVSTTTHACVCFIAAYLANFPRKKCFGPNDHITSQRRGGARRKLAFGRVEKTRTVARDLGPSRFC